MLCLSQVRQGIQQNVSNEHESGKEGWKYEGSRMGQWVSSPVSDATGQGKGLQQDIPTVEAENTAKVNAKSTQRGHNGDE